MPARQPRPTRSQDPEYLAELGGVLLAMTDTQRREFLAGLDRDNLEVAERALAARIAVSWRATPATMAHYLEPESFELYDYWRLLGELFAGAFRGTDEPHQQWWVASQYGKAIEVGTPVPTPAGWRTMGDLAVGDEVIGGNGQPCRVSFVSEVRWGECWRLDFHDGGSLVADSDHQWKVWDFYAHDPVAWKERRAQTKGAWRVVTTADLIAAPPNRYRLPRQPALTLPDADLPLDPYVLGVWLGDGASRGAGLTCADDELLEHVAAAGWPARRKPTPHDRWACTFSRGKKGRDADRFVAYLDVLDLRGNKHVPEPYLWAGDKQRLALLQGLMDTDGGACRNQSGYTYCEFSSTNERLAAAVEHLARSLGIRAKTATGRAKLYGKDCGPKWRVTFTTDLPVFRLSRKARLLYDIPGPRRGQGRVGIKRIERAPSVPCRCIQVDSPDGTYLAGRAMTVTHNTSLMANWGPVWALDMNPRLRLMYVSYDADKAVEEAGKARDIAERHYGHLRFRLRPDKRARGMWSTPQGGGLYAVGVNGAIVGYPADGMLLDDLLKGWVEAHSPATRNRVWSIYRSQIRMRMQSETCPILCAGTRWHMDDVQARLLQLEEAEPAADHWKVTRLATVAEAPNPASSDPILRLPDPLGREVGQVLEPRRFSEREVATRFATLGSYLCTPAETPILMADWMTKPIAEVAPGDEIVGWVSEPGHKMRLLPSEVVGVTRLRGTVFDYTMESGRVMRATRDHRWFTRASRPYRPANVGTPLRFMCPIEEPEQNDERRLRLWNYLAGIVDGEGCIGKARVLNISQSLGRNEPVSRRILEVLDELEIPYHVAFRARVFSHWEDQVSIDITQTGSVYRKLLRLTDLAKRDQAISALYAGAGRTNRHKDRVVRIDRPVEEDVYALETVTGNYVAWGYASANSGSLEQQRPSPEEGGEIKRGWFRIAAQLPDHADDWLSSTDPKLKDKEAGDFVVVQVWARTGKDYWLVDQLRGQWSQAMTINAICLLSVRHPQVRRHVIENTGNGPEVMETLRTAMPDYVISEEMRSELGMTTEEAAAVEAVRHRGLGGLIPNTPRGSKSVRMRAVSPLIEAGDVHLPDPTRVSWVAGLLDELAAFGSGSGHDDQCDALSQALSRLSHGTASVASPASAPLPTGGPSVRTGARFGVIPGARVR